MGEIVDASTRFNAHRHAQWWEAFCSGQMNTTRLLAKMREDEAFKRYCAKRLETAQDRYPLHHASDDMA